MHRVSGNGQDDAIQHKSTIAVQDADFDAAAKSKLRTVLLGTQKLRYPACLTSVHRRRRTGALKELKARHYAQNHAATFAFLAIRAC